VYCRRVAPKKHNAIMQLGHQEPKKQSHNWITELIRISTECNRQTDRQHIINGILQKAGEVNICIILLVAKSTGRHILSTQRSQHRLQTLLSQWGCSAIHSRALQTFLARSAQFIYSIHAIRSAFYFAATKSKVFAVLFHCSDCRYWITLIKWLEHFASHQFNLSRMQLVYFNVPTLIVLSQNISRKQWMSTT